MSYGEPELVKEYPTMLRGEEPLRVYRTVRHSEEPGRNSFVRYHFGFPRGMVEPMCKSGFLETTCYWGNQHWHEDGEFWLWDAGVVGRDEDQPGKKTLGQLNRRLEFFIKQFNKCLGTVRRWAEEAKKDD